VASNLRSLAKSDAAIGAVTRQELLLIAEVLQAYARLANKWFVRLMLRPSHRDRVLQMEMLAATFERVQAMSDMPAQFSGQVKVAMKEDSNG
jgi:hypothetical protein